MTRLLLIRHGEVQGIDPPTFRGRLDLPLTPRGLRQAESTAAYLTGRQALGAVYCSPLSRCVRTADAICAPFHTASIPHPEINDINYGAWTGLGVDEVCKRWPHEAALWKVAPHVFRIPGGESLQDLVARATDALTAILHKHPHGSIAMVTHDSVIRALLCHALGLPLSAYWLFAPSPCGISTLSYADDRFTVVAINETQHLSNP
ncbi:histidine phosphatase family protein [Rhodanobacter sp. Si-c]|uniref:Histidine phosphatase family protein n=1 Tax=Rhodanobacter lycopersici TaxID=3162487 RepID=A0ABV3Q9Q0_9GAMM